MNGVKIPSGFGLTEGEVPYWHGRMGWKANWFLLLLGVLTIWVFGLGVIFFIIVAVRVYSSEYFMTNKRIYVKYGIVGRRVMEIKVEWIMGTVLAQGFMGRILNYGNIVISTPGQYAGSVAMIGVSDPMNIRMKVEEKIRELEREYEFGRISMDKYYELKKKYEEELRKYL